ncbi:MAG: uracil-DNA glycosylase [Herminiimonas sp.]|nr:uracil-DNA glycosylase [Herminiimonas sp.]
MTSTPDRRTIFLDEMGVGPVWTRRDGSHQDTAPETSVEKQPEAAVPSAAAPSRIASADMASPSGTAPSASEIAGMDWVQLKAAVADCVKCGLCKTRTKTVFGTGDEKAKWLFVGEGPGRNEDLQGEPFVGPAGKLLDNMLQAMGLKRGRNANIANIVKCRPIGADGRDRPPTPEEADACMPYLQRQIALIQPGVIVALGKTAALSLLGLDPDTSVGQLRGKVHRHGDLPLVVTYHPAYLLRKPADKAKTWGDLCLAMNTYAHDDNRQ